MIILPIPMATTIYDMDWCIRVCPFFYLSPYIVSEGCNPRCRFYIDADASLGIRKILCNFKELK